jgi:hypothetical protein
VAFDLRPGAKYEINYRDPGDKSKMIVGRVHRFSHDGECALIRTGVNKFVWLEIEHIREVWHIELLSNTVRLHRRVFP